MRANYRLRAQYSDPLADVKNVLAWVRAHGPEYGADPNVVFVTGSYRPADTSLRWLP